MSLYAIGDLHLHFQSQLKAPGQLSGKVWKNHETVFRENCLSFLTSDDTLVLVGDHSWGKKLRDCEQDLEYICSLPGRKILLRGNHDMFWDVKKTEALNDRYRGRLRFLQNSYEPYGEYALVGTKGHTFEGPFYLDARGHVIGWDEEEAARAEQLVKREAERLRISFEAAKQDGFRRFIMFLHYPPTSVLERSSVFTKIARGYGAEQVIYGHCHGSERFHDSLLGTFHGCEYRLVSGDYLKWKPLKILD